MDINFKSLYPDKFIDEKVEALVDYSVPIKKSYNNEYKVLSKLCKRKNKNLFSTIDDYKCAKVLLKKIKKDNYGHFVVLKQPGCGISAFDILTAKRSYTFACHIGLEMESGDSDSPKIILRFHSFDSDFNPFKPVVLIKFPWSYDYFRENYKSWIDSLRYCQKKGE